MAHLLRKPKTDRHALMETATENQSFDSQSWPRWSPSGVFLLVLRLEDLDYLKQAKKLAALDQLKEHYARETEQGWVDKAQVWLTRPSGTSCSQAEHDWCLQLWQLGEIEDAKRRWHFQMNSLNEGSAAQLIVFGVPTPKAAGRFVIDRVGI